MIGHLLAASHSLITHSETSSAQDRGSSGMPVLCILTTEGGRVLSLSTSWLLHKYGT